MKTAIVTGLRGQDGAILATKLVNCGVKVYGLIRRASQGLDLGCAKELEGHPRLEVVEGDVTDLPSMTNLCNLAKADLFFHMAAQSHVGSSFTQPVYTANATGLGTLNCLEAIRMSGIHTRFLNAATSEMFGGISSEPCDEKTPFHPRSPYGVAKLFGYWTTINYRETYKMFACSTICFNHESEYRGPNFVTRKITQAVARIKRGLQDVLYLGNLEAKRDWGYAPDFCEGMIMILNKSPQPKDYVLATGETHSVREFCEVAFDHIGLDYKEHVQVDPRFYRPCEVDVLVGDPSLIYNDLGWSPSTTFRELVIKMVDHDISLLNS